MAFIYQTTVCRMKLRKVIRGGKRALLALGYHCHGNSYRFCLTSTPYKHPPPTKRTFRYLSSGIKKGGSFSLNRTLLPRPGTTKPTLYHRLQSTIPSTPRPHPTQGPIHYKASRLPNTRCDKHHTKLPTSDSTVSAVLSLASSPGGGLS